MGVGILFGRENLAKTGEQDENWIVKQCIPNSPAAVSGKINTGDVLLSVYNATVSPDTALAVSVPPACMSNRW